MKTKLKYTPIALAVAALMASPLTFASGNDHTITAKADLELNIDVDVTVSKNKLDIDIEKDFTHNENVNIGVEGFINPNAYSRAIVNDTQRNLLNNVDNINHDNGATVDGNALSGASGNIGANVAAGDNNQQDNSAAIAVADAEMTFGAADAQSHSSQDGEFNSTINSGNTNTAGVGGNAFQNATGNIGANVTAGNNNQQKNNLAVSVSTGSVGLAMVTSEQESNRNFTLNEGSVVLLESGGEFSGEQGLSGTYEGISDQVGDLYPDIWDNNPGDSPVHGTTVPGPTQHADFDSEAQGAVDRPVAVDTNGDGDTDDLNEVSNGGAFSFNEAGNIELSGSFSGSFSSFQEVFLPSSNDASLSGNAFSGASGNIGVNIASGTGNQQVNSLSLSASTGGTGIGGGVGEP